MTLLSLDDEEEESLTIHSLFVQLLIKPSSTPQGRGSEGELREELEGYVMRRRPKRSKVWERVRRSWGSSLLQRVNCALSRERSFAANGEIGDTSDASDEAKQRRRFLSETSAHKEISNSCV